MNTQIKYFLVILSMIFASSAFGEFKDATLRDEDISALNFSVEHFKRSDGLYEFVYSLKNPEVNLGEVSRIIIDLSCDQEFTFVDLPYEQNDPAYLGGVIFSEPKHTPSAILAENDSTIAYGISDALFASWGIGVDPGNEITGLRLVSAIEPGLREYKITPWVDYSTGDWVFPEDDNLMPDERDFVVTGLIAAPGCPGVTEPLTETYRYPGDSHRKQSETINNLLTYATPQRSRFHVDKNTKEIAIHIYYSDDIDERTFKVQPGWMQRYFNPIAGSNEEMFIPLRKKRTKISLSVHTKKGTENGKTHPKRKAFESDFFYKDHDEFEIRVD